MTHNEDLIFKGEAQEYAPELIELLNIKGKVIEPLPNEYPDMEAKNYKPDLVLELDDKILILEFQSTAVDHANQRRFRHYTSLLDMYVIKSRKHIELHVLSTSEPEQEKTYKLNEYNDFIIPIHSLKLYDANEILNKINTKIETNKDLTRKDLMMLSLVPFMKNDNVQQTIIDSAKTITKIRCLKNDTAGFARGILLIAADKFIDDEQLNDDIIEMVAGKMKSLDRYLEKRIEKGIEKGIEKRIEKGIEENNKEIIINLDKKGFSLKDIAETLNVNIDFVKQILSK